MATPTADTYTAPTGTTLVRCGVPVPPATPVFDSVVQLSTGANAPLSNTGQTLVVQLHGSGTDLGVLVGPEIAEGTLNPAYAYLTDTTFRWYKTKGGLINGNQVFVAYPWDHAPNNGATRRESYWLGYTEAPTSGEMRLRTEERLDAMMALLAADPRVSATKRVLSGGSMGAFGTLTYGIRRPHMFAALYPSRPRWRNAFTAGTIELPSWTNPTRQIYAVGSSPTLAAESGGGTVAAHLDITSYVGNTANAVPWVGWCIGRLDGNMPFADHVDAVAALRAAGRGFAFYWNNGTHSSGDVLSQITRSYPYGTFQLGQGYPVFSEHSLDQDPAVDLIGGINCGLSFRNVAETSGTWSCQVTSVDAACTVKVKPKSPIYTGNPAAQLVTIPAANAWVTVSF